MRGNLGLALGCGLFWLSLGVSTEAGALDYRQPCQQCGAAGTTRIYRTIHPLLNVTRYHDRAVYHRVTRLHYIVDVTRIQPIVHIQDVTRVHHYTIVQDAYAYPPQAPVEAPYGQEETRRAPVYASGCGCMD